MAKKENKKKSKQDKKSVASAPPIANTAFSTGAGVPMTANTMTASTPGATGVPPMAPIPPIPPSTTIDRNNLSPDQIAQMQLEEAIKESQDPSARLKKLRSPLSFRGCLLNLLILVVLTLAIVFVCCYFMVDNFNIFTIAKDILNQFGITAFFTKIGEWFKGIFSKDSLNMLTLVMTFIR